MLRRLALVAGIAAIAVPVARPFPHVAGCVRADFDGVRAARCGPSHGQRAVIVMHGCGGFSTFDHRLAVTLPRYGIATLYVDYFEPTPPPGDKGFCDAFTGGTDVFTTWQRVAAEAAQSLRRSFAQVGAVGWSLGAGVAISAAEDGHHPFDAVAAFSSYAAPWTLSQIGKLPPSIFLDGGTHDAVPPENARALYAAAVAAHVPAALYIYGDGSHGWPGRQGAAGIARAAAFLVRHLR
jgi:dienelactone hydrolase